MLTRTLINESSPHHGDGAQSEAHTPASRIQRAARLVMITTALVLAACGGQRQPLPETTNGNPINSTRPQNPGSGAGNVDADPANPTAPGAGNTTQPPPNVYQPPKGTPGTEQPPETQVLPVDSVIIAPFQATVHPLLIANCSRCHSGTGLGTPKFAEADATTAHHALIDNDKVRLEDPASSRIVVRLRAESHYCWSDCAANAQTMQDAVAAWARAAGIQPGTPVAPPVSEILSTTLTLANGSTNAGGGRDNANVVALYEFKEGSGTVARDTSGVAPAMDLTLSGTIDWMGGGGIDVKGGKGVADATSSRKLFDRIAGGAQASGQYTVEAWVAPANITQTGPARIVNYSVDTSNRNFGIGQAAASYDFRNRSTAAGINANGAPSLRPTGASQLATTGLQHVVMTFDQTAGRRVYIDGVNTNLTDPQGPGALSNWNAAYRLVLGNEHTDNRQWLGQIRLVAIYDRALSATQVKRNFDAGVGDKTILAFDVSAVVGIPGSYISVEAADFDKSSYLFGKPTFVTPAPNNIPVGGIRIAVNGRVPTAGQVFGTVNTTITTQQQLLSRQGAVIAKDRGADLDQFTLVFETLGSRQNIIVEPMPAAAPAITATVNTSPELGIRTFEQINNSMSALTGVSPATGNIPATFADIKEALPSAPDLNGFLASQQTAIAKLALDYCDALVESTTLRANFFGTTPAFEFDATPSVAFSTQAKKDVVINKLIENMVGVNVANQPTQAELQPVLNSLITDLVASSGTATTATRTRTVVKAACASVLSSAALLIQ